ncbi:MAG: ASPIC/UnbV domain-containing protein [Myxococcales bacterium]|nr:ASPIC/UnbV domain-containing protein [Myxococcales bacterium]
MARAPGPRRRREGARRRVRHEGHSPGGRPRDRAREESSRGTYDSIDGSTLLFGLGGVPACAAGRNAATLEIRWPDGTVDKYGREAFSLRSYLRATYGQKKLEPIK